MSAVDLSIVVVAWNTRELVLECLDRIDQELRCESAPSSPDRPNRPNRPDRTIEVWLVDNGSQDGTAAAVRERTPWVEVIALPENTGYACGNNAALSRVRGRVVLLLNSDVQVNRAAVLRCLEVLDQTPDAGAVGPCLRHPDGRPQNTIHPFPSFWTELLPTVGLELLWPTRFPSKRRPPTEVRAVDAVRGAALFVKRDVLRQVGPLAEDYFFFLEETDWCWRIQRAGWRVLFVPDASLTHGLGTSSKRVDPLATRIEYHRSLYRFLCLHRGESTARAVRAIRVAKSLASVALLSLAAPASARARRRLAERLGLLRWHFAGCPAEGGLARPTRSPALDEASKTREDRGGVANPVRGDG